jgi:fructose-1-phosphate kinase PfkB-like protein
MNVARAIHRLGHRIHPILVLGDDATAVAYRALIREQGLDAEVITTLGATRSRIIVYDTGHQSETEIVEEAATINKGDLNRVIAALRAAIRPRDFVVLAGRIPDEDWIDVYARLTQIVHEEAGYVAVIAAGPVLMETLEAQPDMVALTQLEAEALFNFPVRQIDDIVTCGKRLIETGARRALIALSHAEGAVLVSEEGQWACALGEFEGGTSGGVWEALIAGFLSGRLEDRSLDQSLRLGGAAATFAAGQVGLEFGRRDEIRRLADSVSVSPVDTTYTPHSVDDSSA